MAAGSRKIGLHCQCREWAWAAPTSNCAVAGSPAGSRDLPSARRAAAVHNGPGEASSQPAHALRHVLTSAKNCYHQRQCLLSIGRPAAAIHCLAG